MCKYVTHKGYYVTGKNFFYKMLLPTYFIIIRFIFVNTISAIYCVSLIK